MESSMAKRFEAIAKIHEISVFHTELDNFLSQNKIVNLIRRLKSKQRLLEAVKELEAFVSNKKVEQVFFSTAEGYASHNVIKHMQSRRPDIEYIALQHGLFPLNYSQTREAFRSSLNGLCKKIFGVFPFGAGFGGLVLDKYYVYTEREKKYLIGTRGWKSSQVYVKLNFIKADIFLEYKKRDLKQDKANAIFLLQCLSRSGLCSPLQEAFYNKKIIETLSKKYNKLFVKEHPGCPNLLSQLQLPANVIVLDNIFDGFARCKTAYSFFSTALLDAKIFNLRTVGVKIDKLKIDSQIYTTFDSTLKFEDNFTA
ncbi:alpha-2,8-polysialyltransferase family protein [Muricauda oceani]|uniref:Uncharacterized protein n=1 Tax=Flagellimonas oceani TaxID=2698672 RepID=A0A6G7J6Y8_9FLAO|nr:polysialyltransferase family glycosyltransferase [Allomuricauda oceani]MBW8242644.1 alpha-2,8-polysialyltransferase family protein [Allomuricauda oceani]QII46399.1 hypothetical protein GVT53_17490 [Allomuricauda oceani]